MKELPKDCERESLRTKLEDEYLELGKIIRDYFEVWCQFSLKKNHEENACQDLVYVGPAEVKRVAIPALRIELSSSLASIDEWLRLSKQSLEKMIKEAQPDYDEIQAFLQNNLEQLKGLLEFLLSDYERLVREVRCQKIDYKLVLDYTEHLQKRLSYYFRHSSLLFHPDKSGVDQTICQIKTQLFQSFQQVVDISYERLNLGLKILERSIPINEFDQVVKKIEQDMAEFKVWFNKSCVEIEAEHAEIKARQIAMEARLNKTEIEQNELEAKNIKINKKLDKLLRQISIHSDSEDETFSSDTPTNPQFFRH